MTDTKNREEKNLHEHLNDWKPVTPQGLLLLIPVAFMLYGMNKAWKSCKNIITNKKILRSYFRLAVITASTLLTASYSGLAPDFSNFNIGHVLITGMALGASALGAKWTAQLISAFIHRNDKAVINPTNPEKWCLSPYQMQELQAKNMSIPEVQQQIVELHKEKNSKDLSGASFFFYFDTPQRTENRRINQKLEALKNGDPIDPALNVSSYPYRN